jgi:hypothetical protein
MKLTVILYRLSVLFLVATAVVHLSTFTPFHLESPLAMALPFVAVFPTFAQGIRVTQPVINREKPGEFWRTAFAPLAKWHRMALGVLFAYAIFNFFFSLMYLGGDQGPELQNGIYVTTSHGHVTGVINEARYHQLKAYELRSFSGHALLFQACAMSMLLAGVRRGEASRQG